MTMRAYARRRKFWRVCVWFKELFVIYGDVFVGYVVLMMMCVYDVCYLIV